MAGLDPIKEITRSRGSDAACNKQDPIGQENKNDRYSVAPSQLVVCVVSPRMGPEPKLQLSVLSGSSFMADQGPFFVVLNAAVVFRPYMGL